MPLLPSPSLLPSPDLLPLSDAVSTPTPVTTGITPKPLLSYLLDRLRATYVDETLYSDADVLSFLNDAYRDACEESMCLDTLIEITLVAGQAEYALPNDFSGVNYLAAGGRLLEPLPLGEALSGRTINGVADSYYVYGLNLGIQPAPDQDNSETVLLHYSAEPLAFTTYDSTLDARFPVEYADLLVHHVRWRTQLMSGGAERIGQAAFDKGVYDKRVQDLQKSIGSTQRIAPQKVSLMLPDRGLRRLIPNV